MNTALAMLQLPMIEVERPPFGARLGETTGHINGWPLLITLTNAELHIEFTDRHGPHFVVDINQLAKTAVNAIEELLAMPLRNPDPTEPMRPRK